MLLWCLILWFSILSGSVSMTSKHWMVCLSYFQTKAHYLADGFITLFSTYGPACKSEWFAHSSSMQDQSSIHTKCVWTQQVDHKRRKYGQISPTLTHTMPLSHADGRSNWPPRLFYCEESFGIHSYCKNWLKYGYMPLALAHCCRTNLRQNCL